ncbi:MAG: hypothetical protein DRI46_14095 [Chloroflexi bacterium]|nr:MAG: hypothetical protein DRI46_14095 [Chloroflexota bacterium]
MKYLDLSKFKHPVIIERKETKKDKKLLERIIELELTLDNINTIDTSNKKLIQEQKNKLTISNKEINLLRKELAEANALIQSQRIELHSYRNRKWFDIFK